MNAEETSEVSYPPYKSSQFSKPYNKRFSQTQEEPQKFPSKNLTWKKPAEDSEVPMEESPYPQRGYQKRASMEESTTFPVKAPKPFVKRPAPVSNDAPPAKYARSTFRRGPPAVESQEAPPTKFSRNPRIPSSEFQEPSPPSKFSKRFPRAPTAQSEDAQEAPPTKFSRNPRVPSTEFQEPSPPSKYSKRFPRAPPAQSEEVQEAPPTKFKPSKKAQPAMKVSKFGTRKTTGFSANLAMKSKASGEELDEEIASPPVKRAAVKKQPPAKRVSVKLSKREPTALEDTSEETPQPAVPKTRDIKFPVKRAPSKGIRGALLKSSPIIKKEREIKKEDPSTAEAPKAVPAKKTIRSIFAKPAVNVPKKPIFKKPSPNPVEPAVPPPVATAIIASEDGGDVTGSFVKGTCLEMCPEKVVSFLYYFLYVGTI